MGKFKGRNAVACKECHSQKLKCSGGSPCQRCASRGRECIYPTKERYVSVPERYIQQLERDASLARQYASSVGVSSVDDGSEFSAPDSQEPAQPAQPSESPVVGGQARDNYSAERFFHKLKGLSASSALQPGLPGSPDVIFDSGYTYLRLKSDFHQPEIGIKLPPRDRSTYLLNIFEEIFCDYHWFLREDFKARLNLTYSNPNDGQIDRKWICRLSVVLALAQTFAFDEPSTAGRDTSPDENDTPTPLPPGSALFEQALQLFKTFPEEPELEDVETLNLIAFYCYSLNRRKAAFTYASQSIAFAKLLHLDKVQPCIPLDISTQLHDPQKVVNEHMNRLWWTSYCMEIMVATELGVSSLNATAPSGLELPSSVNFSSIDSEQFFESHIFEAQIQLCDIKRKVFDTVGGLLFTSNRQQILSALKPCLDLLRSWRRSLGPQMAFEFSSGISPEMLRLRCFRGVSSVYLRYHQCFTVLLRPLCLQELSLLLQKKDAVSQEAENSLDLLQSDEVRMMKLECLSAARNNCKILFDLHKYKKLAKFGYWDSVHLFSALAMLALFKVIGLCSDAFQENDDAELYNSCRAILDEMAQAGNPAAKDHESLLKDVEALIHEASAQSSAHIVEDGPSSQLWDNQLNFNNPGLDELMTDQPWYDLDWRNLLEGYNWGL